MRQIRPNLNNASYVGLDGVERRLDCKPIIVNNVHVDCCEVVFRHIKHALISKISKADYVLVCCYAIGDFDFLDILVATKGTSIITDTGQWKSMDMAKRSRCLGIIREMRPCVDVWNAEGKPSMLKRLVINPTYGIEYEPMMHNKFIVFCGLDSYEEHVQFFEEGKGHLIEIPYLVPQAIWIGSYNFSFNAASNLESALYIEQKDIATGFYNYWREIAKICDVELE